MILDGAFSYTNIESIPNNLFEKVLSQQNVKVAFSSTFEGCKKLESVSSKIFKVDRINEYYPEQVSSIEMLFKGCENLKKVEDDMFSGFSKVGNLNQLFANCIMLEEVDSQIFNNCESVSELQAIFYNCSNLKKLSKNVFDSFNKSNVVSFTHRYPVKDTPGYFYSGIFENCISLPLSECPEIWKWSQFENSDFINENPEASYECFYGANQEIIDEIKSYIDAGNATELINQYWFTDQHKVI